MRRGARASRQPTETGPAHVRPAGAPGTGAIRSSPRRRLHRACRASSGRSGPTALAVPCSMPHWFGLRRQDRPFERWSPRVGPAVRWAEEEGQTVQARDQRKQRSVSDDERGVLEDAAHHRPEEVGGERGRGGRDLAETRGEREVRQEHGEKGQRHGCPEPDRDAQVEQSIRWDSPRQRERGEQSHVERPRPRKTDAPGDLDGREDRRQDASEYEGVDETRRSEEQRELDDVLRLEQEERDSYVEEDDVASNSPVRSDEGPAEEEGRAEAQR